MLQLAKQEHTLFRSSSASLAPMPFNTVSKYCLDRSSLPCISVVTSHAIETWRIITRYCQASQNHQGADWRPICIWILNSLCVLDLFAYVSIVLYCMCMHQLLYYCNRVRWAWLDWGLSGWLTTLLQCFDTAGWVIRPVKISSLKWPKLCRVGLYNFTPATNQPTTIYDTNLETIYSICCST